MPRTSAKSDGYKSRSLKHQAKRRAEQQHPAKGRTAQKSVEILRDCHKFAANITKLLEATDYQCFSWFPIEHVITERDDDHVQTWRSIAEYTKSDGYETDDSGLFVELQSEQLRVSNRIACVCMFRAERDADVDLYVTRKTIFSPFPCEEWGVLPLTLHQWRVIALPFIISRACWQWQAAVNWFAERHEVPGGYVFQQVIGWNLEASIRPAQQPTAHEVEFWTGPIIYSLATTGFSKLNTINGFQE